MIDWQAEWPDGYDPEDAWVPPIEDLTVGDPLQNPGVELKHDLNPTERAVWLLINHANHEQLMADRLVRGVDVGEHLLTLHDALRDKTAPSILSLYRDCYRASLRAAKWDSRQPEWHCAWLYARALRMAGRMDAEAELIRDFLSHWEGRWERNGDIEQARRRLAAVQKRLEKGHPTT